MMRRVFLATLPLLAAFTPASAQGWRWSDDGPMYRDYRGSSTYYVPYYGQRREWYRDVPAPRYRDPYRARPPVSYEPPRRRGALPRIMEGGPRPHVTPIPPERVRYESRHGAGTIIIDTAGRQLLLIENGGTALRYPISVGREGFTWTGVEKISRIAEWPDWHPPAEMRQRDPRLPEKMTGGLRNPLGAKALYLGNTLYRIHGTNDRRSIGRAQSSGCFRMLNGHVIDLAARVGVGTKVVVSRSLRAAEAGGGRKG